MKEQEFVKLTFASRILEADRILELLRENGIEAYRKGSIMDVYQGTAAQGGDIMVLERELKQAQEILAQNPIVDTDTAYVRMSDQKGIRTLSKVLLAIVLALVGFSALVALFP